MDGFRKMQINSRERAISTDINSLQTFHGQDFAEMLRALVDSKFERTAIGVTESTNSVLGTPVTAAIFQGLLVQPQAGASDVLVAAGLACFINPDGAADESNYKFIRDVGVGALGTLLIAPNPGISARVDVVECQVNATPLTSSQSRDIFDQVSGLFTAASVVKTTQGRLTFRVRQGIVGSGYPGNAAGWLPLAVVVAPAGSANNDGCEFWDVRPMLQDRTSGLMNVVDNEAAVLLPGAMADIQTNLTPSGFPEMTGVVRANYRGWVAGGTCKTTVAGADANYIRVDSASPNVDPLNPPIAFGIQGNVFACFPFGLPRWCRYNRTPGARIPGPFNGIPVVSLRPASPIGEIQGGFTVRLPTSLGFGAAVDISSGVALLTVPCSSVAANLTGCSLRGNNVIWGDGDVWTQLGSPHTATSDTFTLTEDADFPRNITKFGFQDRAYFNARPGAGLGYNSAGLAVLIQRTAFFSPSGYGVEDSQTETLWVPGMESGSTTLQSESRMYWESIPKTHPDAGPNVFTFVRSWTTLSPTGFVLSALGRMIIRGWYMR